MSKINGLNNNVASNEMLKISKYLNKYPNYYKIGGDESPLYRALEACEEEELTFSKQKKNNGKHYSFCNITLGDIPTLWKDNHYLSEVIRTEEPIKCFFDLDIIEKDEEKTLGYYEWDWIRTKLMYHINNIDTGVRVKKNDFVVSYSRGYSKKKGAIKVSYHIIILNYWFKNMVDFKKFISQLHENMKGCSKASIIIDMIDWGIVKKNQVFKLPYQSKAEEDNPDRIQKPLNDKWTVYDFLVSARATANTPTVFYDVSKCIDEKKVMTIKTSTNKTITVGSWDKGTTLKNYQSAISKYRGDVFKDLIEPRIKDCFKDSPEYYLYSIPNTVDVGYDLWSMVGMCLKTIYNKEEYSNDERGLELWAEWTSSYDSATKSSSLRSQWNSFKKGGWGFPTLRNIAQLHNCKIGCNNDLIDVLFRFEKKQTWDYIECNTDKLGLAIDVEELVKAYTVLYIKSPMATGKSYMLRKIYESDPSATVLVLSCKRSFASSMSCELGKYGFKNYDDVEFKYEIKDHDRIICSIESLRFCRDSYDYLIIDESETIATNLVGEMNMKHNPIDNMIKLYNLVNNSHNVFVMDAYLFNRSRDMIVDIMKSNVKSVYINNIYKFPQRYIQQFHREKDFVSDMDTVLEDKTKEIVFVSNTLKKQEQILQSLKCSPSIIKYNARSPLDKKLDVNKEWDGINLLTYTPTITAGVSCDKKAKDILYLYTLNQGSCLLRDTIQASKRVRRFNNNSIRLISTCIPTNGEIALTFREVAESQNNFIESLSKDLDWLKSCEDNDKLRYIVNVLLWCKLEENLNIRCFNALQNRFYEEENIKLREKICKVEKDLSDWDDDLGLSLDKIDDIDIDEYNELCIMKQDSNVLDDDDFRKYLKYKYLNIDIKDDTSDEIKSNVFQEIGLKQNRDVWNKNIQFKRFVETILREDNLFESVNIDKRIEETIMSWGKVGDKAEIQQKYLIRWKYLFEIMNDMGFVKDQRIVMKPFMTSEYDKLISKYKTISYRSLTQIFDNTNLRISNVKDDKIVNFTTRQMNGIFKNLLGECLGLTLKQIGRKKIKGRDNTIFEFVPDSPVKECPMNEKYYNLIKYKHKPEKKRYKFKKVIKRLK